MKPLFLPLNSQYYDEFASGEKRDELRRYGPRWNESTCTVGRDVMLSKGYGKKHRMAGRIWKFKRQHGSTFGSTYKAAILDVYGTLDIEIACISIELIKPSLDNAIVYFLNAYHCFWPTYVIANSIKMRGKTKKVHAILKKLEKAGMVRSKSDRYGEKQWQIIFPHKTEACAGIASRPEESCCRLG